MSWSESLYRIYGLEKNKTKITFKTYLELLHPEDRSFLRKQFSKS
ncbi:PAS domain-containing protein [Pedobacter steynii]